MRTHHHESWWLIESTYAPTRTLYYAGHRKQGDARVTMHMVDDASKAVRFPNEWGAKYALAAMQGVKVDKPTWPLEVMGYRVAEHTFDYTPHGVTPCPAHHCPECGMAEGHWHRPTCSRPHGVSPSASEPFGAHTPGGKP